MIQEFNRIIGELQEQGKTYPKMWTNDVIKIITHLRDVLCPKEPEAVHGNEAEKEVLNDFISAIQTEFADTNWDYLPFIAERVLENRKNG